MWAMYNTRPNRTATSAFDTQYKGESLIPVAASSAARSLAFAARHQQKPKNVSAISQFIPAQSIGFAAFVFERRTTEVPRETPFIAPPVALGERDVQKAG